MWRRTLTELCILSLAIEIAWLALIPTAPAQENAPLAADGPWISSVAWLGDSQLVGTKSQGLLLRPAQVVKVSTAALNDMETIGEAETSLWRVLPIDQGRVVATDYKGGIHMFGEATSSSIDADTRWIRALAQSPAEGEILAGTEDGKLLILSVSDKKELRRIDAHSAAIFDIAVNAKGDQLATVAGDGTVKVWSWPACDPLGEMSHGEDAIWSVLFTPDGSQLITGGADRAIQLWDAANYQSVLSITKTRDWITDLVALPDSAVVIAACMDGKIVAADYQSLQKVAEMEAATSGIWAAALSENGKQIALGTRKQGILLVDLPDWKTEAIQIAEEAAKLQPPSPN